MKKDLESAVLELSVLVRQLTKRLEDAQYSLSFYKNLYNTTQTELSRVSSELQAIKFKTK